MSRNIFNANNWSSSSLTIFITRNNINSHRKQTMLKVIFLPLTASKRLPWATHGIWTYPWSSSKSIKFSSLNKIVNGESWGLRITKLMQDLNICLVKWLYRQKGIREENKILLVLSESNSHWVRGNKQDQASKLIHTTFCRGFRQDLPNRWKSNACKGGKPIHELAKINVR